MQQKAATGAPRSGSCYAHLDRDHHGRAARSHLLRTSKALGSTWNALRCARACRLSASYRSARSPPHKLRFLHERQFAASLDSYPREPTEAHSSRMMWAQSLIRAFATKEPEAGSKPLRALMTGEPRAGPTQVTPAMVERVKHKFQVHSSAAG